MRLLTTSCLFFVLLLSASWGETKTLTDALGRTVTIPDTVSRLICSGSGCLRLLTYLQGQNLVVAVDDIEGRRRRFDARPYAMANPQFKQLPIFGAFRGKDNPELILSLDPAPEVILKLVGTGKGTVGLDPDDLQQKTGIPVVALQYGNFGRQQQDLENTLRIMGEVTAQQDRAEEVITFFTHAIQDLQQRTTSVARTSRPTVYIGGVAYAGPHGFQSTEPGYPPFTFAAANNMAAAPHATAQQTAATEVSKEQIVAWDPDLLFLDLATLQLGDQAGGLYELKTDPAYQLLQAVQTGKVYGLLPYNWYNKNFGSILANAYYIGKLLYPKEFIDIDPQAKADAIYQFLVGKPMFTEMNRMFKGYAFGPIPLR